MANASMVQQSFSLQMLARFRRFFRWLTSARVILSLIMLVIMFVMVVIPSVQFGRDHGHLAGSWISLAIRELVARRINALSLCQDADRPTGQIYTYRPLQHSMTVAIGSTLLALLIGGSLAWMVVRTDMPDRKLINQLAVLPYIMPSWTLAQAWLVLFKNRLTGGTPGVFESVVGASPPDWLSYGAGADHHLQRAALLHLLLPVRLCGADVDRFQPGRSRRPDGRQPLAHPAQDHLPARHAGDPLGRHHDLLQGDGHLRRTECSGHAGQVLCRCNHDSRRPGDWR